MILFNSLMRKPAKLKNTHYRTGILKYECANEMQVNLASTVQRGQLNLSWTGQTLQVSYFALWSIIYNLQSGEVPQRQ